MIKYLLLFFLSFNILSQERIVSTINTDVKQLSKNINCELIVSSGYRTYNHNKKVGGVKNSFHLHDLARDLVKPTNCKKSYYKIGIEASKLFKGVIIYHNHVHVDLRKKKYFVIIKK